MAKFIIVNRQTGEKRMVRDNLFEAHFRKFKDDNKKEIWVKRDELTKESLSEPIPTKQPERNESAFLKAKISELESKNRLLENELEVCKAVNFPKKTDERIVTVNPFDIKEVTILQEWLTTNNIPFPKTIKSLNTLRKRIPEIYKK